MCIPRSPYLAWLPLLVFVFAPPALADGSQATEQQIAADLRQVAAFEHRVQRALDQDVQRSLASLVDRELERQNELLARLNGYRRAGSVPASHAGG